MTGFWTSWPSGGGWPLPLPHGPEPARSASSATANPIGARMGGVHLTVSLTTLMGLADSPGEVAGYGPVTADIARSLAHAAAETTRTDSTGRARWCFTVIGDDGEPVHHGHLTYRPPAAMRHLIEICDRTCRFPGCRRPARSCDLDHRTPYDQGGATCPCNMAALCRHHHRLKHTHGWELTLDDHGRPVWYAPSGRHYVADPDPPPTE